MDVRIVLSGFILDIKVVGPDACTFYVFHVLVNDRMP